MAQSEIQERVAKLNTQLRFGKFKAALIEAYKLRTYLQLGGVRSEEAKRELQRVEKVIAELEGKEAIGIQKLVNLIVRTAKASLNPTEEESRETLLDRFAERPEEETKAEEAEPQEAQPEVGLGATAPASGSSEADELPYQESQGW